MTIISSQTSLLVKQALIDTSNGRLLLLLSCLVKFTIFIEFINNSSICKQLRKHYSSINIQRTNQINIIGLGKKTFLKPWEEKMYRTKEVLEKELH